METLLTVRDYDLDATLDSGQVFRWRKEDDAWVGVIGRHRVRLSQTGDGICAQTAEQVTDWQWLREFLQSETDLAAVLKTFPDDEPMRVAVAACHGLRLLRQDPWECLASFILSSTKQIVQIRQIVALLCEKFGEPLIRPEAPLPTNPHLTLTLSPPIGRERRGNSKRTRTVLSKPASKSQVYGFNAARGDLFYSFPSPKSIAGLTESDLRACKMGFRAPHLLAAARQIADGKMELESVRKLDYSEARAELMKLRGVGGKIADCVLLFAYGHDSAFPVDVWIERALRQLYFPRRRVTEKKLRHFAAMHFGPHAGYAQQYLFHYIRTKLR